MADAYDVLVIGGGHAGAEAAWIAARLGAKTALVTMSVEAIGRMSCNPAIGGLGKGQMVREIDALGGLMGLATDAAGIQFRMLNRSKGPAVWAPRAQADRESYARAVQSILLNAPGLTIVEGSVESILTRSASEKPSPQSSSCGRQSTMASCCGRPSPQPSPLQGEGVHRIDTQGEGVDRIETQREGVHRIDTQGEGVDRIETKGEWVDRIDTKPNRSAEEECSSNAEMAVDGVMLADGRRLRAQTIIVTTGTFLRALMHCGEQQTEGGRIGEASATGMSASLRALGLELGRLKTGTPPRVHRDSIDYDECERQPGDDPPTPFSFMTDCIPQPQVDCWITWTHEGVHESIRANLHRAPMYSGQIQSHGPRYCPSIEDKVVRFADKTRHQIFLEPEGYDNERVYCNGISTSLPKDVQETFVRKVPGLRRARILQHGYAVEYDYVPTHQTRPSLECKRVSGLFLAGQINGTSGYEEAAAQGLIAGINAVQSLRGAEPLILGRDEAYIGVMIDDLVTRPPTEPYRMFTSRAEYRLLLRADNADQRLTPLGRRLGSVDDDRWERFERKRAAMERIQRAASRGQIDGTILKVWMRRPDADPATLARTLSEISKETFALEDVEQVLIHAKYQGYVDRQSQQIERFRRLEGLVIPDRTDYSRMLELRLEAREKLARVAPRTLGQAARISGVSPADITVLWVYVTGRRSAKFQS